MAHPSGIPPPVNDRRSTPPVGRVESVTHPHPLIRSSQVRDMLGHKVSRERIGTELDGMIKGPDPLMALEVRVTGRRPATYRGACF